MNRGTAILIIGISVGVVVADAMAQLPIREVKITDPEIIAANTPAPLYRDPVYDGAADPVLVWNPDKRVWWMFYTQRRAKIDVPGVEWCHGTEIGVAESKDQGMNWVYRGTLPLSHPDSAYSFWAPDVIRDGKGQYHLFVSYVPGAANAHRDWGGERHILHYFSKDLWNWKFDKRIPLSSDFCIDATLFKKPDGSWRMWYKDEGNGSKTLAVESNNLKDWKPVEDPGVSKLYGEGPKTFRFKGHYWLIKDPNSGLDVYRSEDLENWIYQGKILDKPGTRNSDGTIGKHADVVVCGDRAYIIYFTHPYTENAPERDGVLPFSNRHTALQAAEIEVVDGRLVCDRDKPFRMLLSPPREDRPVPVKVMNEIYKEVKTPYKYGVVITGKDGDPVDCPSIFRQDGKWYMMYICMNKLGYETHLAGSDDLLHWQPLGKILTFRDGTWDAYQAAGYIALQDPDWKGSYKLRQFDKKYWLSYLGGALQGYETDPLAIGIAWTTDPTKPGPWIRLEEPVLTKDQPDCRNWEKLTQYKSNVIYDESETLGWPFVMYYNGKTESGYERIGMAVSNDMRQWVRFGKDPVIDNGSGISGDPQVVRIGDVWVMFYFGAFWKPNAFDTFACSYDLVNWTKWEGQHLVEPSVPWDQEYAHKPWVVYHNGVVYHFYCAVGNQGRVIGLATSKEM
ncbi:MAG: hypothetical protein NTV01_13945 [Bacteroidia bacterium]|nr:hypothetical protein [Bacteroidia bacterium]